MANDVMVVIGFVIVLLVICKIWNLYTMKQYEKSKENRRSFTYGVYVDSAEKLGIVGVGNDENGDYDVAQAIKKVDLPKDVRIKVNE